MSALSNWLDRHGLGKHAELFAAHDIDLDVIGMLTDADLKGLGVSLGDRRRILKAASEMAEAPLPSVQMLEPDRAAERRQLTVMFTDLVGSTHLSGRYDPEEMQAIIADYQKAVGDEIVRFGGYVAKPLGDGLLVYFGWPHAHEDDAGRALRAALAAIAAVARLRTPRGEPVGTRIGIATGDVLVGDFANAAVAETGAVVGETPNLAARLQSLAAENTIAVAGETRRLVGGQFAFTDLGDQTIRGFDAAVRVWRLDGELASESRFEAAHGARLGALVGREHETGFLMDRWQQASEGACQLVLISGEAGIGKSRLVAEVVRRLGSEQRISYQASPLHTNTGLYPVLRQLESRAGFAAGDPAAVKFEKLAATLPHRTPAHRVALAYLADLMSLEVPSAGNPDGAQPSADAQREAALETLVDAVSTATEAGPLLIVVEDAHWLDPTTQEFVGRILARLSTCHVMLLVTYRPEFEPPWAQHGNVGLLSLSRFGRRHALEIVNSLLAAGQSLAPEVAEAIVARSDGVPLFVEELTGSVLDAGGVNEGREVRIPATLRDTLSERLDKLGSAKEVAQVAAAIGREFSSDLVAAALGRSEAHLSHDLDRLLDIGVVFRGAGSDRRYVFKHALLQDAAYDSMPRGRRREVHARLVDALTSLAPDAPAVEPEVLATHLAGAGEAVRAAECWSKAGANALRRSSYREVIGALHNALDLVADDALTAPLRAGAHAALATAHFHIAEFGSVAEHLKLAADAAEVADDKVMIGEIAVQQAHVLNMYGGDVMDAVRVGERALEIAIALDDDAIAYGARFCLGQSAWVTGDFARAIDLFAANLPENLEHPERIRYLGTVGSLKIDSIATLSTCHAYRGEFDRAQALAEQSRAVGAERAYDVIIVSFHTANILLRRGNWEEALPIVKDALAIISDAGTRFAWPWFAALMGYGQALAGTLEEGVTLVAEAATEAGRYRISYAEGFATSYLAEALLSVDVGRALETAERGLKRVSEMGYRAQEAELHRIAAAALAGSDNDRAEHLARKALDLARTLGMRPEEAHCLRVLGDMRRAGGKSVDERHGEQARAIYRELGMTYWLDLTNEA